MPRVTIPLSLALSASLVAASVPTAVLAQASPDPATTPETLSARLEAAVHADGEAFGIDLEGARTYVGDRITTETYDGVLKGAVGTYLTGSGSSADQALLLQRLIEAGDPSTGTRFAMCDPDENLADELRSEAESDVEARGLAIDHLAEVTDEIEDPELRVAIDEVVALRSAAKLEARNGADWLASDLVRAGYVAQDRHWDAPDGHVWLQADIDGTWVDVDTTSADGSARCAADSTFETLPHDLQHEVRISVIAEERTDGELTRSELLTVERPMADLAASRIALLFGEPAGLVEDDDPSSMMAPYTPVLRIDGDSVEGALLELPRVQAGLASSLDDTVGGVTGLFESLPSGTDDDEEQADGGLGGMLGGADADEAADDLFGELGGGLFGGDDAEPGAGADLTGLWLDIELVGPDGQRDVLRSELLDRIGFAARAGSDIGSLDLEAMAETEGDYAVMSSLWQIGLLLGEVAAAEAGVIEPVDPERIDSFSAQLDGLLRTFPALRRDMGGYTGVPTVMVARLAPADIGDTGASLVLDALHVPSRSPAGELDAARDAHAIIAAERFLVSLAGDVVVGAGDNGAIFGRARDEGTLFRALVPGDTTEGVSASPRALARIEARLSEGFSLLVPETPADFDGTTASAWWLVDPATGIVRDEHESGRHQASAEQASGVSRSVSMMNHFRRLGCRLNKPLAGVFLVLFLTTGASSASPVYRPLAAVASAARKAQAAEAQRKAAEQAACAL
jgi:hypothetical protein